MDVDYTEWLRVESKSLQDLAIARALHGDFKEVLRTYYKVREELVGKNGDGHRSLALNRMEIQIAALLYLQGEFDGALKFFTRALEDLRQYPNEHFEERFEAECYLGILFSRQMNKEVVGIIYREMKDVAGILYHDMKMRIENFPVGDLKTVELKRNLALSIKQSGDLQSALEIYKEVYKSRRNAFEGKNHITEYSFAEVGMVLLEQGKYREALSILERVQKTFQLEIVDDISYLRYRRYLADAHLYLGLVKIAEDLYRNSVETMRHKYALHPEMLITMHNWARSLVKLNKPNEALVVLKEVHCIRYEQSPKHPDTAKIALDIAGIYLNLKEYTGALANFIDVPSQISSTIKWNPDLLLHSVTSIGSIFDVTQDVNLTEQLLKVYQHVFINQCKIRDLSDHHKEFLQTRTLVGQLLISLQKGNEALEIFKDVLEKRTLVLKNDYTDCLDVLINVANAYSALGQRVEAFEYYSEVYEIQTLITGDNTVEAVKWKSKIMEITNGKDMSVLIDAVVSNYRISIKSTNDSENNVNMEDNNFPLHVASETGRIAMIKFLLYKGAIYNEENSEGKTPENVASNNAIKSFFTFVNNLFIAVKKTDYDEIDRKLDIMNDTKFRDEGFKAFPLLLKGEERIHCIVDKSVLNARDETGSTPLHLACSNGDIKTVNRLLELEVDHTLTDKSNRSPGDVAEEKSHKEILLLLDSYIFRKSKDIDDNMIPQKNPEMPEDIMDQ